jgi:hypothetical protein
MGKNEQVQGRTVNQAGAVAKGDSCYKARL